MIPDNKILYSALYTTHDPFYAFQDSVSIAKPDNLGDDGILLLHGGEDISPKMYNQRSNKYVSADDSKLSRRDELERDLVDAAVARGIPIIGICRGAQLLCAMAGGKLVQHVENHHRDHAVETYDNRNLIVTSCHHQMMYPFDVEHRLLAKSCISSPVHLGENNEEIEMPCEPEVVYFPQLKALAIQPHPEWMGPSTPFVAWLRDVIKEVM